jgi:hypothetical protein
MNSISCDCGTPFQIHNQDDPRCSIFRGKKLAQDREKVLHQEEERASAHKANLINLETSIRNSLSAGESVYLKISRYVEVNSTIEESSLSNSEYLIDDEIRQLGILGWRVVGVAPRTIGVALQNRDSFSNTSYGGGIGGNVAGVHVILEKEIHHGNVDHWVASGGLEGYLLETL